MKLLGGVGSRRAGAGNAELRRNRAADREYISWCHERFRDLGARTRVLRARAEIAEGRLQQSEQLINRQAAQLQARDAQIAELEKQLKFDSEETVETPRPVLEPELEAVA
ncbi:hypothetical protein B0675_40205 [Streptomyces sp. M41(2017)]|uniref:hypothetical protein n=1 Tax=Streptomyces sp. M41(2017) TaxID=1955065 RepID=UPI0009BDAD33|nr:hypothetical protein [Streptomyces sp. M41(2017)]OQQ13043.1 hypothetical protein B0675_40205 [Streptomyces sp. M41(2017)]